MLGFSAHQQTKIRLSVLEAWIKEYQRLNVLFSHLCNWWLFCSLKSLTTTCVRLSFIPFLRCKEGYQGVRCDQFLPKTDSILSDPSRSSLFLLSLTQSVGSTDSGQRLLAQWKAVVRSFVSEWCQGWKLGAGVSVQGSCSELTRSVSGSGLPSGWDLVFRFSSVTDLHWELQQTLFP